MSRTGFDRHELGLIAIGGVLGAALRWWITDVEPTEGSGWFAYAPGTTVTFEGASGMWSIAVVNLLGTLLLGAVLVWRRNADQRRGLWLAIGTGFCGSLTTFSTFAVDIAIWLTPFDTLVATTERGVDGSWAPLMAQTEQTTGAVLAYLAVSLIGGIAAFGVGRKAAQRWTS